ncbi:MAG: hypothetical protein KDD33_00805 [Bdellovibrionales bacterium]|nr:hypothetical protein [Bdellovibrionales bacterium]
MGESIGQVEFSAEDEKEFQRRLREETKVLKNWFEERRFEFRDKPMLGLEVEAWLVDENYIPNPVNKEFLAVCDNPDVVEELSKFNFELNTDPKVLQKYCFKEIHQQLAKTWDQCLGFASKVASKPMLIGIHPLLRDQILQLEYMSEGERYRALNDQLMKMREGQPVKVDIQGFDHFAMTFDHIMLEAAATSVQVHIQANQEDFRRVFNASMIAAIPCVAIAANSPFVYGHDLWDESRIPLFEQAIQVKSFRDKRGTDIGRVTFGTGYIRHSLLEIFLENLNGYPPLIPILFEDSPESLHHLRFHNGTLWRWNRPIIGFDQSGTPHLRVEQRAMASGPSLEDIVANMAFSVGLTQYLATEEKAPEESMTFTDCRNNFYEAARLGLNARVRWFGKEGALDQLILSDLIPKAKQGLRAAGVDAAEIEFYLEQNIHQRVLSGQNGARWQRAFIDRQGRDFQALTQTYLERQMSGTPVHKWTI